MKKFISEQINILKDKLLGERILNTRIIPLDIKIVLIFMFFILISNLTTNYLNLSLNRTELIKQAKVLLVKELKEIYSFCNNQYEIYLFNKNLKTSVEEIENKAINELKNKKSIMLGVNPDRSIFFQASKFERQIDFSDKKIFKKILDDQKNKKKYDGFINFTFNKSSYFGVYKYNTRWNAYIIRAEELNEFYQDTTQIFINISLLIIIITIFFSIIGIYLIRYILRFVGIITKEIMRMIESQKLGLIELKNASNDNVTFLGVAFNSLSSTINNLMGIFLKFVNQDIANKAYNEKVVRLEGSKKDLTILFSDIKSFTFMTETLGINIIKLLNMHYEQAIKNVINQGGIIGSIIGDALLAVYGSIEDSDENKSYSAIKSAYAIQDVASNLRTMMKKTRNEIEGKNGKFTDEEENVYKAVSIEVGVGIDGGDVFYGTIGSTTRMTNTVIGDNVNSASRLEGLTRIYKIPVICSEYIKEDIEKNVKNHGIVFIEIDQVQVKGKTVGKKIFYPIFEDKFDSSQLKELKSFSNALQLYYKGEWSKSFEVFEKLSLPLVDVFKDRTKNFKCPKNWNGIWTMTSK